MGTEVKLGHRVLSLTDTVTYIIYVYVEKVTLYYSSAIPECISANFWPQFYLNAVPRCYFRVLTWHSEYFQMLLQTMLILAKMLLFRNMLNVIGSDFSFQFRK